MNEVPAETLAEMLSPARTALIVAGVTTDCCVDATARDAFHRDYHLFILRDGCAPYERHLHEGALNALEKNSALLVDNASVPEAWA